MTEQINWIDKMIERQTLPKKLRVGTVEDFCEIYDISSRTYYYHCEKKENQQRINKICLRLAKDYTPDVLVKLAEKAQEGDMKAIDMFLKYILEFSENLDIKSGGELLQPILVKFINGKDKDTSNT